MTSSVLLLTRWEFLGCLAGPRNGPPSPYMASETAASTGRSGCAGLRGEVRRGYVAYRMSEANGNTVTTKEGSLRVSQTSAHQKNRLCGNQSLHAADAGEHLGGPLLDNEVSRRFQAAHVWR